MHGGINQPSNEFDLVVQIHTRDHRAGNARVLSRENGPSSPPHAHRRSKCTRVFDSRGTYQWAPPTVRNHASPPRPPSFSRDRWRPPAAGAAGGPFSPQAGFFLCGNFSTWLVGEGVSTYQVSVLAVDSGLGILANQFKLATCRDVWVGVGREQSGSPAPVPNPDISPPQLPKPPDPRTVDI